MSDSLTEDEFERRFLVAEPSIVHGADYEDIEQAYVWADGGYAVRIRLVRQSQLSASDAGVAHMTIKGPRVGFSRYEAETRIDPEHANQVISLSVHNVVKRRYHIVSEQKTWDIDEFRGRNSGLVIAEFEGSQTSVGLLRAPYWAGYEVTSERRFDNELLAKNPVDNWRAELAKLYLGKQTGKK